MSNNNVDVETTTSYRSGISDPLGIATELLVACLKREKISALSTVNLG